MIILKKSTARNGAHSWSLFSDSIYLGTIQHPGTADWRSVAWDGTKFAETSQRKIVEKMRRHAMAGPEQQS